MHVKTANGFRDDVHAVVVAYQPDGSGFLDLLRALSEQGVRSFVIDNTPASDERVPRLLAKAGLPGVSLLRMGENAGIAAALNVGIRMAMESGALYVLLSDQDSLPEEGMVDGLLQAVFEQARAGSKVGAVAPAFVDRNTGIAFPFQVDVPGKLFYSHERPEGTRPVIDALTLITSGMLVPVAVFEDVGLMREDFFIDHVDIEWCHRARSRGWSLFGTSHARMLHSMGADEPLRVWYFGWRMESAYSPVRMYYRIRNFVALCRLDYVPGRWKARNGWYWLGFVYSHVVFGRHRWASLRMAMQGLFDGLRNVSGPYRTR